MMDDEPRERYWPGLTVWADVDPARHPFDPDEALAVVRSVAPPQPPLRPDVLRLGHRAGAEYRAVCDAALRWNLELTDALVDHYGPWAFGWHWAPGAGGPGDERGPRWDLFEPISTPAAESLVLVAAELVRWRRWLEELAQLFARLLPSLGRGGTGPGDTAGWETAITHLLTTTVARDPADGRGGPGQCSRVLIWFLSAAGLPEQRSVALADEALEGHLDGLTTETAATAADIAARLAWQVTRPATDPVPRPGHGAADWPDTWPQYRR